MCYQLFRKESVLFTPKNTLLERILATLLAKYEEDSLDGDSFVSRSRFDAYAIPEKRCDRQFPFHKRRFPENANFLGAKSGLPRSSSM